MTASAVAMAMYGSWAVKALSKATVGEDPTWAGGGPLGARQSSMIRFHLYRTGLSAPS
jgi:hypothetical protein